ncbi:[dimethylamine--corrinoid protein] Co-methyltransferase [Candidatus Fermentibacteria bacterium]|nr:[dimethylamine--corrinoid protein] Co-methyltransferase [Candidatus Fermentibacteria bacterium]
MKGDKILTRMGDGERVWMAIEQAREDVALGSQDAGKKGNIAELCAEDQERLLAILAEPGRIVSVSPGEEVVVTDDGAALILCSGSTDGGSGLAIDRQPAILAYERTFAPDTVSTGIHDYSFKPVKAIMSNERQAYASTVLLTTAPLFYGSQPNLGLYFQPDGPHPNPAELLPKGDVQGARQSQEEAAAHLTRDMVFVGESLYEMGCEGLNFDTAGSAGDADFYAALMAIEQLKMSAPNMAIEVGMAGEFVLGMHGQIVYRGERLAGMFPHQQVKMAEAAGADIFGPAVNVNTSRSFAWNLARAVTFVKATVEAAGIPVHANVGMGVCGVPMCVETPIDCVTRTTKALVQIGKIDGL